MRILLIAPNYLPAIRYGGPVQSSHGLAKALVGLGHEVTVFTTNIDGPGTLDVPLDRPVMIDGVSVRYFPIAPPRRIYYSPSMGRALTSEIECFDVLHTNGMFLWPGPKALAEARRCGVPAVVSPRGMLVPEMIAGKSALAKRSWIALLERRGLAGARTIHVTSDEEADGVRRLGLDLAPLVVIGNGVELPGRLPTEAEIGRVWRGIPSGQRVAFLGRLDWTKGVEVAIAATMATPAAQILVAGPDQIGLRAALEPRLTPPNGGRRGRFIGEVDGLEKWALLAGADVVLVPSVKESFGMSAAEALALGTPVICSPGVGASSIVRRIDPGCVVERSAVTVSGTMAVLLADAARRDAFARGARRLMEQEYTWAAIARQMLDVYAGTALARSSEYAAT